jgi:Flp pilus assembly pilin Flp
MTMDDFGKKIAACKLCMLDRRGTVALEYSLLSGILAVIIVAGMCNLAGKMQTHFDALGTEVARSSDPANSLSTGAVSAIIIPDND